jgi:hypothetical protein
LARGAQNLRDAMYRQQLHDEAIRAASNVTKLRASGVKVALHFQPYLKAKG